MAKYSDQERADAIMMLQASGFYEGESGDGNKTKAVNQVYTYFKGKYNKRTLLRWGNKQNNPAPDKLVANKKRDMTNELKELVWLLVDHVKNEDTIADMSGQQAITSIGILIDKIRLLMGLPTQIIGIIPDVISALEALDQDPVNVFNEIIRRAHVKQDADHK